MKVICTQENLSKGLQLVSHVASKNVSLPILSNVLLRAERGGLTLQTTNLELGVTCVVRGKVEQEGSFTVQGKTLNDYINLLPNENVTLELAEQNLKIGCRDSKTVMKGVDATEFPLIPEVEAKYTHGIDAQILKEALDSVAFAVAFDETRPEISGIYFDFSKNTLTVVATDSYRLAEKKVEVKNTSGIDAYHIIVPIKTVQELIRVLGEESGPVEIQSNENQVRFSLNGVNLTSRVIEGQYPDYEQIIPREHQTQATVGTREFTNTIRRASLFCKPGGNDIVLAFSPAKSEILVSATNLQVGESEARQEASIKGGENSIIFNYRFLLDGLQNIKSSEVILELNTNATPGLLKPKSGGDYTYIIMPIKQ
ncbi:MAG: DNA polymerase III subunit beta [Patescibacteria group bacterium]